MGLLTETREAVMGGGISAKEGLFRIRKAEYLGNLDLFWKCYKEGKMDSAIEHYERAQRTHLITESRMRDIDSTTGKREDIFAGYHVFPDEFGEEIYGLTMLLVRPWEIVEKLLTKKVEDAMYAQSRGGK